LLVYARAVRRALLPTIALLAAPGGAGAAELQTWETSSRYVDPAKEAFNPPPPGAPPRPNALRVNVLLPDRYDGRRRFPVLYLLHGHGDAYDHWANEQRGDVARIAAGLGAIVVMPEGARGWYANWWKGGTRGDPAWERYHLEELIPLVEQRLQIRPGRRWRAIAGLSMGGLGALHYASQRPGYFGSAASFSGAISIQRPEWPSAFDTQGERHQDVYGDPEANRFYWTGHNPTALVENLAHTRVYVTVGDGTPFEPDNPVGSVAEAELKQHAEDFVAAARAAGVPVTYVPLPGIHDWPYWRQHLANAVEWGFFGEVQENPESWDYESVAQAGSAWPLEFRFDEPPTELMSLSRDGAVLRGAGSGRVTITTGQACELRLALPFERRLEVADWVRTIPTLRLRVRPRFAAAGRPVRLRFRVTTFRCGRRGPAPGATVRLGRRRATTNALGRASMRVRVRLGRQAVRAAKRGYRGSVTNVTGLHRAPRRD
jgi:S-formylglutathione hydrolase FrmB